MAVGQGRGVSQHHLYRFLTEAFLISFIRKLLHHARTLDGKGVAQRKMFSANMVPLARKRQILVHKSRHITNLTCILLF